MLFEKYIESVEVRKLPVGQQSVSDVEAVGFMRRSVPDESLIFFFRMLVSAMSQGCNLKAWILPGVALVVSLDSR